MDFSSGRSAPRKTRSACNRCHAQKLRCVRKAGQLRCERCLRLDTVCLFSPRAPRRSIRQREHSSRASLNQQTANVDHYESANMLRPLESNDSVDLGLEWPVQNDAWGDLLGSSSDINALNPEGSYQLESTMDELPLWAPGPDGHPWSLTRQHFEMQRYSTPESPPAMSITHRLANMSIALAELTTKLPSTSDQARVEDRRRTHQVPFIFDELFCLTTKFTDLVKHLLVDRELGDEATALMVGSCHSRLVETYGTIFSLIEHCIQHSLPPVRPDWAIVLPQVQLGSLTSPAMRVDAQTQVSSGKTTMYMLMITVFSSQLWTRLIEVVRGQHTMPVLASGVTSLVHTLWTEMVDRMDRLLQTIERTQGLLR